MRGVVWEGNPFQVSVQDLPMPVIQDPTDALVRITAAGICGTDLHVYHGIYGSETAPYGLGHEGMGIITEVGNAVQARQVGEYVVIPDTGSSGHLDMTLPPFASGGQTFGLGTDFGVEGGCQCKFSNRRPNVRSMAD